MKKLLFGSFLLLLFLCSIYGQEKPVAFINAKIIPIVGQPIEQGILVVQNGKILAIGDARTVKPPADAQIIDAKGKVIMPGIVDTHSHIGEGSGGDGSSPIQPDARILDALNVQSSSLQRAQAGGITTVNVMPGSGHLNSGQTLYLKLRDGANKIDDLLIMTDDGRIAGGMKFANGTNSIRTGGGNFPGTRAKSVSLMREQLIKAQEYREKIRKANGDAAKMPSRDLAMEGLVEVLDGKRIVHFHTHRHDDIMSALRLQKEFGFRLVLHHVSEGWKVADEIAKAKVPTSIILIDSPGGKLETTDIKFETPGILDKAGVLVGFHTDDPITDSRLLLRMAALGVRAGMSRERALYALTMAGAKMLDLDKRVGSLETGKDADFIVLSGDPLSVYTHVLLTYVEGKKVFDRSDPKDYLIAVGGYGASNDKSVDDDDLGGEKTMKRHLPFTIYHLPFTILLLLIVQCLVFNVQAQIAVKGETVWTMAGENITNGVILIGANGKIEAVGTSSQINIPANYKTVSAKVVTPGLIDAHTVIGLNGYLNQPNDQMALEGSSPIQPELRAFDAYNAQEELIDWVRSFGVTTIHTGHQPSALVSGQTMIAKTFGKEVDNVTITPTAMIAVTLGDASLGALGKSPGTRAKEAAMLRGELVRAQSYGAKPDAPRDLKAEMWKKVLSREIPLLVTAQRAQDIMTALRIAKEFNIKIVLDGAAESYQVINEIKASGFPVIIHPTMARENGENENLSMETASKLKAAGIPVALQSGYEGYVPKTRVVLFEAAVAAANGLSPRDALATITIDAAKILGIESRVGSIEKGKDGDLAMYDGDPFEYTSHCTGTIINGQTVSDVIR